MVEEAGKVLLDLIGLSMQIAKLETVPSKSGEVISAAQLPTPTADSGSTDG